MQKRLHALLGVAFALFCGNTLQAQDDVTDLYLKNAGFDDSLNVSVTDSIQLVSGTISDVKDWSHTTPAYSIGSTFTYGTTSTFNADRFDVPAAGYEGSIGGGLVLNASWSSELAYTQTVTLPAGKYALVFAINNRSGYDMGSSRMGFVPTSGVATYSDSVAFAADVWTTDTLIVDLAEETTGDISVGFVSANAYSYENAALCIDFVQILKYDELAALKLDFNALVLSAEGYAVVAGAPASYNLAELTAALDDAKALDLETVDETTLQSAYDELKTQMDLADSILEGYNPLKYTLFDASRYIQNSDYPGKPDLEAAIVVAQTFYDKETYDLDAVDDQVANLQVAIYTYRSTRPSEWENIKNGSVWNDTDGNPVQAHGAGFLQVGDTWYMIGEDRSERWNPDVNMYSTKDFVNWKFENKIIENGVTHPDLGTDRMIERAKLMYNKKTGKYIVWCHWEASNYGASEAAVFYCDSINGDYTFHWGGRPMGVKSRDCNIFVDEDDKAYFISTTSENTNLGLFELSDDYLSVISHTVLFPYGYREAPAIVKLDGLYYMITSGLTGWAPNQAMLCTSTDLKSGWTALSSIGNAISFDTQAASILPIIGTNDTSYLYVGDRWQDPDLPESKTIIFPVDFHDGTCTFEYSQQFDVNFATGEVRETETDYFVPKDAWSIKAVSSEETSSENAPATNVIDGNTATIWHTNYSGTAGTAPHSIEIDMGAEYEISGFLAAPRLDGTTNGLIREYLFYTSLDGENWDVVSGGYWMPYYAEVYFMPTTARYVKLVSLSGTYATLAELDVLQNTPAYTEETFTNSFLIGDGDWIEGTDVSAIRGEDVTLGPLADGLGLGSWAWHHDEGNYQVTREAALSSIAFSDSGSYTALHLDVYNRSSMVEFHVAVGADISLYKRNLTSVIGKANVIYLEGLPGAEELDAVITEALTLSSNAAATIADFEEMTDALLSAIDTYLQINTAAGENLTSKISSPSEFSSATPEGWSGSLTGYGSGIGEVQGGTSFRFYQTISGLENGYYLVGVQGFYRNGANNGGIAYATLNDQYYAYLYAGSKSVLLSSLYEETYTGEGSLSGYSNTLAAAKTVMDENILNYGNWILVEVTNGSLNMGVRKSFGKDDDWCAFTNFELYLVSAQTAASDIEVDNREVISKTYYNLSGVEIREPQKSGVYLIEKLYNNGETTVDKIFVR